MIFLVPGLLAFVFGWFAFRSRVTGVYLSIITQAMTYALLLPKGIIGTFNAWWEQRKLKQLSANAESADREDGVGEPRPAE